MSGGGGDTRERLLVAAAGVLLLASGLGLKLLAPPAIRASMGGAPYVALWATVFRFVSLRVPPLACALAALALTCALEVLQLWHPPWLEAVRGHTLGALVLGTSFDWADFPPYVVGAGLGWALLALARRLARREPGPSPAPR